MSGALRPDDAPDDAAGCAHAEIHWHPPMPRGGMGATPDHYVQRGVCRCCRRLRKRVLGLVFGHDEDVEGAPPVPLRGQHDPRGGRSGRRRHG